jgi:hypothetical protein
MAYLRDIFGNPFRPVAFDPAWRTSTAVALAQMLYNDRDFGAMPILADALQDADCDTRTFSTTAAVRGRTSAGAGSWTWCWARSRGRRRCVRSAPRVA